MTTEEMIRELENTAKKYDDKFVGFGETNIPMMCRDVVRKLKELQNMADKNCGNCSRRSWYQTGFADAKRELENKPGVSKEFLEDCKQTADKYRIKTYLDRFHNMSDVELADWLFNFYDQQAFTSENEIIEFLNTEVQHASDR